MQISQTSAQIEYLDMQEVVSSVVADNTATDEGFLVENVLDGDPATIWHTEYSMEEDADRNPIVPTEFPHWLEFVLHEPIQMDVIRYEPRGDNAYYPHYIKGYEIYLSESADGEYGDQPDYSGELAQQDREIVFEQTETAAKLKLVFLSKHHEISDYDPISMSVGEIQFGVAGGETPSPAEDAVVALPQSGFAVEASSSGGDAYSAGKAIDGDAMTLWHGQWDGTEPLPHWISLCLDQDAAEDFAIESVSITHRKDAGANPDHPAVNGVKVNLYVSSDGQTWGDPVVSDYALDNGKGVTTKVPVNAYGRYVKVEGANNNFMAIAELDAAVYNTDVIDVETLFALTKRVAEAKVLAEESAGQVGDDFGQYPQAAYNRYLSAIADAEQALADKSGLSEAIEALNAATDEFLASEKRFTADLFDALRQEARALQNRTQAGEENGQAPQAAKDAFEKAIVAAEQIDLSGYVTEEQLAELFADYQSLKQAMAAFRSQIIVISEDDVMSIAGTWQFREGAIEESGEYTDTIELPGSTDEAGLGHDNRQNISPKHLNRDTMLIGLATYERTIQVPADWAGKTVTLNLERTKKTKVQIDGQMVGPQQLSLTTPHVYDVTAFLKPGETQTLTIEVNNDETGLPISIFDTFFNTAPDSTDRAWCHQVSEYTQTNWNGIVGKMELKATPSVHITDFQIRPNSDLKSAAVTLRIERASADYAVNGTVSLSAESFNHEGEPHRAEPQEISFAFAASETVTGVKYNYQMGNDVKLWDEFTPNLYTMKAVLTTEQDENNEPSCTIEEREFGMRRLTVIDSNGGRQFLINDKVVMMRGEINCAAFPKTGYAPMELEEWMKIMQTYKDYGINHVRFHTWVPPEAAFKAADRLGLYLNFELPNWSYSMFGEEVNGKPSGEAYYQEDTKKIFQAYLNSPSAVMMALGNELRPGWTYYQTFLEFCEKLEPDLLLSDIAGHSYFPESADFAAKHNYGYLPHEEPRNTWNYNSFTRSTPVAAMGHEPGQVQVYPDYEDELPKYEDAVLKPRNLEYFWDILKSAGIGDMSGKFSDATGSLSAMFYRYFAESYIRTDGAGGFQLLGLQDFPGQGTALVGILDAFLESKGDITPEEFRQSCSELVVLAELDNFVLENNQQLSANLLIGNFAANGIHTGINWSLETETGDVIASGSLDAKGAPQGANTDYGRVTADLNGVDKAQRLLFKLSLTNEDYAEIAPYSMGKNEYEIWVFPAKETINTEAPDDVNIYRDFSPQAEQDLKAGKKVLIVSEGNTASLPKSRAISFRQDFWSPMFHGPVASESSNGYSLGVYIDQEHPMFRDFPTQEFANWQWYGIEQGGARGMLINGAPVDLKPIVQPISTIDQPDRLAAIFEAKVYEGKLMVSTLNLLDKSDAASKQLLSSMLQYMHSDDFNPTVDVEADFLKQRLPTQELTGIQLSGNASLQIGETAQITVKGVNSKGQVVALPDGAATTYESADKSIVTVDVGGVVTAVANGMTTVTATVTAGETIYTNQLVVTVGQAELTPVDMTGVTATATSQLDNGTYKVENAIDGNLNTIWHSAYQTTSLPQSVTLELPQMTELSAVYVYARPNNPGGGIYQASIFLSDDGQSWRQVVAEEEFNYINENRVFAFDRQEAKFIKIQVEKSLTQDNAASFAEVKLYNGDTIVSVENPPAQVVRFGTALEKILKNAPLPEEVEVFFGGDKTEVLPVIWSEGYYNPNVPGDYTFTGHIYKEGVANFKNVKALYTITVLPKDETRPPNVEEMKAAVAQAQALNQADYTVESWSVLEGYLNEAANFGALTAATQHDADVLTEKILDAMKALVPVDNTPSDIDKTALKALIAAVDGKYDEGRYTAESWKALTEAL
ncbi:discoidin domain-containing protein, partial [Ligaoa zhengdingensis]